MSNRLKKLTIFISIIIVISIFTIGLNFLSPDIPLATPTNDTIHEELVMFDQETGESKTQEYDYKFGENITGIRITDLVNDVAAIKAINYKPSEFLEADKPMKTGEIVDLTNKDFIYSNRGTIQLIILEPDPFSPTYKEDIKSLEKFRRGDYWYITLELPNIFTAANIFVGNKCIASHGEIKDYDFIKNSITDNTTTDKHKSKVDTTLVELEFYTKREAMNPNMIASNQIITIHYELDTNTVRPLNEFPLIGLNDKLTASFTINMRLQIILASISCIVISIFLFIIFLKKKKIYMPLLLSSFGIFVYSTAYITIHSGTTAPLVALTLYRISPVITMFTVLISILLGFKDSHKRRITLIATISLFIANIIIPICMPFVSYEANSALKLTLNIILPTLAVISIAIMIYGIIDIDKKIEAYIIPLMIALSIIIMIFYNRSSIMYFDAIFWILLFTTIITFLIFLKLFNSIEKENVYLTSNLKTEIEIHTNELVKALDERNTILQFVTHDLKKPTAYYINALHKLETKATNPEDLKIINTLLDKSNEINESLKSISEFSKLNFLKEKLIIINLKEYIEGIYNSIAPDCEASGVYLTLDKIQSNTTVFAKNDGLKSTLLNIIFNALEHSGCKEIKISVLSNKENVEIHIADDGKGINDEIDIFQPYVSELRGGSHGLGLYICKQAVESMNGKIEYETSSNGTTFIVTLLKYKGSKN